MNRVFLIGNIGADPDIRTSQSGTKIAHIRVATTERVKDGDEWKDRTEWHSVVVFGGKANYIEKAGRKGRAIAVEGKLRTRKWTDQNGNERYTTEVIADDVRVIGGSGKSDSGGASQQRFVETAQKPLNEELDDDVPF